VERGEGGGEAEEEGEGGTGESQKGGGEEEAVEKVGGGEGRWCSRLKGGGDGGGIMGIKGEREREGEREDSCG
jgi:hypothetical protein